MKIKKLRQKLKNPKWVKRKYEDLLYEEERWNRFWQFECNWSFNSYAKREYSKKKYYANMPRVERQLKFIGSILTKLT